MPNWIKYAYIPFVSVLLRLVVIKLYTLVVSHSDGWDGYSFTFCPIVKREYSITGRGKFDDSIGYDRLCSGEKIASWIFLPIFPVYWLYQMGQVLVFVMLVLVDALVYGGAISDEIPSRWLTKQPKRFKKMSPRPE